MTEQDNTVYMIVSPCYAYNDEINIIMEDSIETDSINMCYQDKNKAEQDCVRLNRDLLISLDDRFTFDYEKPSEELIIDLQKIVPNSCPSCNTSISFPPTISLEDASKIIECLIKHDAVHLAPLYWVQEIKIK